MTRSKDAKKAKGVKEYVVKEGVLRHELYLTGAAERKIGEKHKMNSLT